MNELGKMRTWIDDSQKKEEEKEQKQEKAKSNLGFARTKRT